MKTEKILITLSQFIDEQEKIFPSAMDREEMQKLVISKYQSIAKYNRFLNKPLSIDMFEGDGKIFLRGKYVDIQPSTSYNYYTIGGKTIFRDRNTSQNGSLGLTVHDIAGLGVKYLE